MLLLFSCPPSFCYCFFKLVISNSLQHFSSQTYHICCTFLPNKFWTFHRILFSWVGSFFFTPFSPVESHGICQILVDTAEILSWFALSSEITSIAEFLELLQVLVCKWEYANSRRHTELVMNKCKLQPCCCRCYSIGQVPHINLARFEEILTDCVRLVNFEFICKHLIGMIWRLSRGRS